MFHYAGCPEESHKSRKEQEATLKRVRAEPWKQENQRDLEMVMKAAGIL
jgi:hypothetical protein